MYTFRTIAITVVSLFISQALHAECLNNFWFRATLSKPLNSKVVADVEFQHRRQAGFSSNDMFDNNLMFTYRSWIHYQHNSSLKFSVSPFAYFSSYKIIRKLDDESATPKSEIRFSAAVEKQLPVFEKCYFINRVAIEYRVFENANNVTRARNRFGLQYKIATKLKVSIFDEIILNVTGVEPNHFYDHNRIGLEVEYKITDGFKMNMGYLCIDRLPITERNTLQEHNILLNLTYLFRNSRV